MGVANTIVSTCYNLFFNHPAGLPRSHDPNSPHMSPCHVTPKSPAWIIPPFAFSGFRAKPLPPGSRSTICKKRRPALHVKAGRRIFCKSGEV